MKHLIVLIVILIASFGLIAQERITLTSPIMTDAGATVWGLHALHLNWGDANILIVLREADAQGVPLASGKQQAFRIDGDEALTLMRTLNKLNLSSISLTKRVFSYLQTSGRLGAGSSTGDPTTTSVSTTTTIPNH